MLELAYKHSKNNKAEIEKSDMCGCFYCGKIFTPNEIKDWIRDSGETALCPYCKVDAVIGRVSGVEITHKFLNEMNKKWFN